MTKARRLNQLKTYQKYLKQGTFHAKDFGFPGVTNAGDGDLSRFSARWSLAVNFESIELCGYNKRTVKGYTEMIRLVLAVNAAEQLARCLGIQVGCIVHLESTLKSPETSLKWSRSLQRVLEILEIQLSGENLKRRISLGLREKNFDIWAFAFGVRHLFSHGVLTAGANDVDPVAFGDMCKFTSNFILESSEQYFAAIVRKFEKNHPIE